MVGGAPARAGFLAALPLWLGIVPFGVVFALAARAAGLGAAEAAAMSLLVYSGTAQLVAADLLAAGAGPSAVVLSTLLVSLRHLPLGASLAPALRHLPRRARAGLAFQLTDPTYALSVGRVREGRSGAAHLFGAGLSLYLAWQIGTLAGLALGGTIPDPAGGASSWSSHSASWCCWRPRFALARPRWRPWWARCWPSAAIS